MSYHEEPSEGTSNLAVLRVYVRELRECRDDFEERIRKLEDLNLEQKTRHKQLVIWLTIACSMLSGAVDIAIHLIKGSFR
jgi:hypothetical protein